MEVGKLELISEKKWEKRITISENRAEERERKKIRGFFNFWRNASKNARKAAFGL